MPAMDEPCNNRSWAARVRGAGLAALLLLPLLYGVSYRLLLVDESRAAQVVVSDIFVLIPPEPKPCYGEKYRVEGEGVRLFFWPANRVHRTIDRFLSNF
jgi:hypothetical protein